MPNSRPGPPTVAFVEHKLNLETGGGSNLTLHRMACALTDAGYRVYVITLAPGMNRFPADLPYTVIEHRLADSYLAMPKRLALVRLLFRWQRSVDLFQIEAPSLMASGALYRALGGRAPVVARLHTYSWFCSNLSRMDAECFRSCSLMDRLRHRDEPLLRKLLLSPIRLANDVLTRLLANRVDRFISLSRPASEIEVIRGLNPERLTVIPPIVDGSSPGPISVRDSDAPLRLLYVGRLTPEKGVDVLLRAVAQTRVPLQVDIVGDGLEMADLKALSQRLGTDGFVKFHGWLSQDSLEAFYSAATAFVHPGRWPEPAGRTVMDALAWNLPVITSDVGGPPWIAGDAALTFKPGDYEDLRLKIEMFEAQPALAPRLSKAAQRRARDFRPGPVTEELLAVYRDLIPAPATTPAPVTAQRSEGGRP